MPKYQVIAHRKVLNFLSELTEKALKDTFKTHIEKLSRLPLEPERDGYREDYRRKE